MSERETPDEKAVKDFLRDRLPADKADEMRKKIKTDPALRAELALQQALAREAGTPLPFPGEAGWRRLNKQLK